MVDLCIIVIKSYYFEYFDNNKSKILIKDENKYIILYKLFLIKHKLQIINLYNFV